MKKGYFVVALIVLSSLAVFAERMNCQSTWHWLIREENFNDPIWSIRMEGYIVDCM